MIVVQDYVPFGASLLWKIHAGYFRDRGAAAWSTGEVPYGASSNGAHARQLLATMAAHVVALEEAGLRDSRATVRALEVGGGSATLAANLLHALDHVEPGTPAARIAGRFELTFSDMSEKTLADAAKGPLARWVGTSRLVVARVDANDPRQIVTVDGRPLDGRFTFVLATYVACVLPVRAFRREGDVWSELCTRVGVAGDAGEDPDVVRSMLMLDAATRPKLLDELIVDYGWATVDLDRAMPTDASSLRALTAGRATSIVVWPVGFFALLDGLHARVEPYGAWLTSDFGAVDLRDQERYGDPRPRHYGNSLAIGVSFSAFDAWATARGREVARTADPTHDLQTLMISVASTLPEASREAIRELAERPAGQLLLDLIGCVGLAGAEHALAARLWARCADLVPWEPSFRLGAAARCNDANLCASALFHLDIAGSLASVPPAVLFETGRALFGLGRHSEARAFYLRRLGFGADAATEYNLGLVDEVAKDLLGAIGRYRAALRADPNFALATNRLDDLRDRTWNEFVAQAEQRAIRPGN